MVNGTAESRSHWVTYALGTTATAVVGTKGVGTVSKTGAAATKAAVQKSVTATQNALHSLRTLELPQLLPYTPRLELALPDGVPVNVVDGNHLKEQLMLMAKRSDAEGTNKLLQSNKNAINKNNIPLIEKRLEHNKVDIKNISSNYGFDSIRDLKGFQQQTSKVLAKHKLSLKQFHVLRLKPILELTNREIKTMKEIRDAVPPITKDALLQKTIPIKDVEKYLSGEFSEIGGYVAKVEDVVDIRKYGDMVESSRLDYKIWDGSRPYPKDGDSYAMIRFKTSEVDKIEIPYGKKFGGSNSDSPPCTLNGFTGARNGRVIPEWEFVGRFEPRNGAELYKVINGNEELIAIFDIGKFRSIK